MQKRMLVEQRAVIERLSCKLGKDHEDVELQFSAAVAKVMAAMMVLFSELKKTSVIPKPMHPQRATIMICDFATDVHILTGSLCRGT